MDILSNNKLLRHCKPRASAGSHEGLYRNCVLMSVAALLN
jgi:hypothetical protein